MGLGFALGDGNQLSWVDYTNINFWLKVCYWRVKYKHYFIMVDGAGYCAVGWGLPAELGGLKQHQLVAQGVMSAAALTADSKLLARFVCAGWGTDDLRAC
jgi:hypothetical protein